MSSTTSTTKPGAKHRPTLSTSSSAESDQSRPPHHARQNQHHEASPSPHHEPSPSPHQNPQEPNLAGDGGSAGAGDLGDDFINAGGGAPEAEVIPPDPDLLTPEEFQARFASWFDMPGEILTGTPSEASRDAAARALHAEISKSSAAWFRALASRKVGSVGNWGIVLGFVAALVRQASNQMGAANVVNPQQEPQGQGGGGSQWPPKV